MSDIKTDPPAESKFQTQEYLIPKLALAFSVIFLTAITETLCIW
jgi:hypothetical protein